MKYLNRFAGTSILGAAVLLAGCGGDGGGGGIASTPLPPTYQTVAQLSGTTHTYQTSGIKVVYTAGGPGNFASYPPGGGVTVAYTASTSSYLLTAPDGTMASFGPSDLVTAQSGSNYSAYSKQVANLIDTFNVASPLLNGVALTYTVVGSWDHFDTAAGVSTEQLATGGVPTLASDVPRSGTANYTTALAGAAVVGSVAYGLGTLTTAAGTINNASNATFTANFAAGTVATALTFIGTPLSGPVTGKEIALGSFNGTGTITSGGPGFAGTFAGTTSGGFSGGFNGPQAAEFGYSWFLSTSTLFALGQVWGKKN